jgi:PEP-CTERM motif
MTRLRVIFVAILALRLLTGETARAGTIYDAAADFSPTNNPNGVWSYGWSQTLGSTFNLDTTSATTDGLNFWEGPVYTGAPPGSFPVVGYNGTTSPITWGTVQVQPGQLWMHPGPQDQYSVIRFTAPTAGTFVLATSFNGIDFVGPSTTDVHVIIDWSSIFNGNVDGYGPGSGPSFTTTLTLHAGDTVDFAIGYGADGNYFNDSTGITATLSSVPEPASLMLLALGLSGMGVVASNRFARRS